MGGRYKRLSRGTDGQRIRGASKTSPKAIDCYEQGMELDLNAYYCSSNLPRLYRTRGSAGDEERAQSTLRLVIARVRAREAAMQIADEWLRPTLLAAAFDLGEPDKADELADAR